MSARRLLCWVFVMVVGVLVFACAPALAAAPETPETGSASAITAHTATLEGGVLNPNAAGEPGEYEYLYKASESECQGGSVAPVPEAHAAGLEKEVVSPVKLTGLKADRVYTFCLVERVAASPGEVSPVSAPVTFTTLEAEPSVESEYVSFVESSGATLNAQVDPDGPATTYLFQYGTSESYGESTVETALPENGTARVRIPVAGKPALKPDTTYHYRVVAVNVLSPADGTSGSDKTFTTPATLGSEFSQGCANEQRRDEQPYALELPDCRAYEMVSPLETLGNDATDSFLEQQPRASVSGGAVTYGSAGAFADPTGSTGVYQYVSRRGSEGWSTENVTPLHDSFKTEIQPSYEANAFTPELSVGIASTNASLTSEAPPAELGQFGLYVHDFAKNTYRYVGGGNVPEGVSSDPDLSRVVFGEFGVVSEWIDGNVVPVSVANSGENLDASVGAMAPSVSYWNDRELWHAVSADGSRVYFTSPQAEEQGVGQLYVRVNAERSQSPLVSPEASGTGTLTEGSNTVTSLVTAAGTTSGEAGAGSSTVDVTTSVGRFVVGQGLSGSGIAPGTTITQVAGSILTLSAPTTERVESGSPISSDGPAPFVVGEEISGDGIPRGTTVTAVAPGSLTLSAPTASSGSVVALNGGGGCTVSTDACTIEVSASQRLLANPAGTRTARYWGASADGSRVFFTSDAELTEDAYTGPAGDAANLYEYDLERPEGERLKDLTVDKTDTDGAAVSGVVQISEDGSYVYFVATGDFGGDAVAGQPNLYVSHDDGAPVFIATLANNDIRDWHANTGPAIYEGTGGPEENNAVVTPSGNRLAFLSEKSLTGYDNQQAEPGECEGPIEGATGTEIGNCKEIYLYDAETGGLVCASCDPTGARPTGPSSFTAHIYRSGDLYRARNLVEGGALFFDSSDALVSHASDGRQNVYEYENGRVYAISDVAGGYESFFMDASANGHDVFFASADQLLPENTSNNVVVYDARVDGGFSVTASPPSCDNGDACKPPPAPQPGIFGAPGSATFSGPGNIEPAMVVKPAVKAKAKSTKCKKAYVRKKGKCVKRKISKKKAKKSSDRKGSK